MSKSAEPKNYRYGIGTCPRLNGKDRLSGEIVDYFLRLAEWFPPSRKIGDERDRALTLADIWLGTWRGEHEKIRILIFR